MKKQILILTFLCPFLLFSQERASVILPYHDYLVLLKQEKPKYNWRKAIAPAALSFVGGGAWGLHETIQHHWPKFNQRFPGANPKFWNPYISWQNKYRGWPNDTRRTGVPIFFTDAKHTLASINQVSLFAAGVTITIGEKRPILHYVYDAAISFGAYSLGNKITYDWLFR